MNTKDFYLGIIFGMIIAYVLIIICTDQNDNNHNNHDIIKILTRQAARWSTAAEQDKNSMISVLHANYGAGYLWALKDIASDKDIKQATGINMKQFTKKIVEIQDQSTKTMAKLCPKYAPQPSYLTTIGGEGMN